MIEIIKGTTPTITYTFDVVRVSDIRTAVLTIKRSGVVTVERDLTTASIGVDKLSWTLTQEETLSVDGNAAVMLNWVTADGTRGASAETSVYFAPNHKEEVI